MPPPVLFLTFNRPETTRRVFAQIRLARPRRLYLASDGPRKGVVGDASQVLEVRQYVESHLDWPCELRTLYREKNLGCGRAVSEAITWFFEQEEAGIILEDDTLPHLDFFTFAEIMLEKHALDENIFHISGTVFAPKNILGNEPYFLSAIPFVWGWASWRRAWKKYDFLIAKNMHIKPENWFLDFLQSLPIPSQSYWRNVVAGVANNRIDTWDYQWGLSCIRHKAFCLTPVRSLVKNIGFNKQATHTRQALWYSRLLSGKGFESASDTGLSFNALVRLEPSLVRSNDMFMYKFYYTKSFFPRFIKRYFPFVLKLLSAIGLKGLLF